MATKSEYEYYQKILKILGSLTNLFSESKVPYLNYRITENLFCKACTIRLLCHDAKQRISDSDVGVGNALLGWL